MNILIASDSFKDALPALEVCRAIEVGIRAEKPDANIRLCPLADGGEGTFEVLETALGLQKIELTVSDPLFRPINTCYGISAGGETAFVELAKTAGLQLLLPAERNPLLTSTFGVGQQIADALNHGAQDIILAIGGSATNDAGIGMAAALGWIFYDQTGAILAPTGRSLGRIWTMVPPLNRPKARFQVICDVTNPLFGPNGAAHVYARQKGANDASIEFLEDGLRQFAQTATKTGAVPDPATPGAGAAGGMGFGAMLFLNAELRRGIDVVLDLLEIEEKLRWADLVVTGEGKIDAQTGYGKLVQGLCIRASKQETPVIAFCGRLEASTSEIHSIGLQAAFSINEENKTASLEEMLKNSKHNLERTAKRVFSQSSTQYLK